MHFSRNYVVLLGTPPVFLRSLPLYASPTLGSKGLVEVGATAHSTAKQFGVRIATQARVGPLYQVLMCETSDLAVWDLAGIPIVV